MFFYCLFFVLQLKHFTLIYSFSGCCKSTCQIILCSEKSNYNKNHLRSFHFLNPFYYGGSWFSVTSINFKAIWNIFLFVSLQHFCLFQFYWPCLNLNLDYNYHLNYACSNFFFPPIFIFKYFYNLEFNIFPDHSYCLT